MGETFLSEGWVAALAEKGAVLPKAAGVNLVLQHEVAGAPDGKVRFFIEYRDGQIKDAQLGKHATPDILIEAKAPAAIKILNGEMSPDVAYMQGRLKVDGDYRRFLIDLRDWRASEAYAGMWADMAELTLAV